MKLVAAGDLLFSSGALRARWDERIVSLIDTADVAFANAEICCPGPERVPMPRKYAVATGPWALDELKAVGFNALSFANNHAGDYGPMGVLDTIEAAEARGLPASGIGRNLADARSADFVETPSGRVGIVSATTTKAAEFLACDAGAKTPARPGVNPLRWSVTYRFNDSDFETLRDIAERTGSLAEQLARAKIELVLDPGAVTADDRFVFGSADSGVLAVRGTETRIETKGHTGDMDAICRVLGDARTRSDFVIFSLHAHEGVRDGWYADEPAEFVQEMARKAIDAGAHIVVGHGPHMLRGVEVYRGAPILYSLNGLMFDQDSLDRIHPEMYGPWGGSHDSVPADLHEARKRSKDGTTHGFFADHRMWEGAIAEFDAFGPGRTLLLHPTIIHAESERAAQRGMPSMADGERRKAIAERLVQLSQPFGTRFDTDPTTGSIRVPLD